MASVALRPWFAVAKPHEDIREGRLSEAVFAANLWRVATNDAPEVYLDTDAFFTKTYLTGGLKNVLRAVGRALCGGADAGDRILSLQTAFGGGKTHALVALWHLAKHTDKVRRLASCAAVREALGDYFPKRVKAVAVFTNQVCDATQGRKTPDGIHTRTLWGELALQLGGAELYGKVEANDRARSVPQGLFVDILREAAPCVILLDELADYCVGASAVEVGGGTLADQTISFAQQLTEAVGQVPGTALIATLPASHLEVASREKGEDVLNRLERRFGRMGADKKPVADDEIYEVIRRRLFDTIGDPTEHEKVAEAYAKMYQAHKNEVPPEAAKGTYKERIAAAYPFHPALIDALYLRWGSHGDFQRTRGVLRLLASVVGDLWSRRNTETMTQPLIQPCHVNWTLDPLHAALTRLWGAAYEAVVAADVVGSKANAALLDQERGGEYATERVVSGLASAILLGSFGGQGERAGYSTKDLRVCIGRPGVNWGYTDSALLLLEERGFFLHTAGAGSLGKRYWFGTKPTLVKLLAQYRAQFATRDFDPEVLDTLKAEVKRLKPEPATWHVLVNPEADLAEQKSLTLLVLPPDAAYAENGGGPHLPTSPGEQRVLELSQRCGKGDRHYRNTLLFLLPSPRGLTRLRNALREVEVHEAVGRDYESQLDDEQKQDLGKRLAKVCEAVPEALCGAYMHVARVEKQGVVVVPLSEAKATFADHLLAVWNQVVEEDWVLRKVGSVTLQEAGLVPNEGGTRIKQALEAFLRYTDKPMLATRDALLRGLADACQQKLIGIGRGVKLDALQAKWCGPSGPTDLSEEGLWIIPPFEPEPAEPAGGTERPEEPGEGKPGGGETKPGGGGETGETKPKQVRRVTIKGSVPAESWGDVFRCFVGPAARMGLKRLRLGIDFCLETPDGQPLAEDDPKLKAIRESVRQLGLEATEEP